MEVYDVSGGDKCREKIKLGKGIGVCVCLCVCLYQWVILYWVSKKDSQIRWHLSRDLKMWESGPYRCPEEEGSRQSTIPLVNENIWGTFKYLKEYAYF